MGEDQWGKVSLTVGDWILGASPCDTQRKTQHHSSCDLAKNDHLKLARRQQQNRI